VQVAFLGGAGNFVTAGRAVHVAAAGGQRFEDGVEVLHDVVFAADHLAVAAFESPDAAAGANVDVVNALAAQFLGAADVVDVIGVAPSMMMSPTSNLPTSSCSVESTTAAGTISQMARGFASF